MIQSACHIITLHPSRMALALLTMYTFELIIPEEETIIGDLFYKFSTGTQQDVKNYSVLDKFIRFRAKLPLKWTLGQISLSRVFLVGWS